MRTRSMRRHLNERNVSRTLRRLPWIRHMQDSQFFVRRWADNRQKCSCPSCGHKRRWQGKTAQERRQQAALDAQKDNDFYDYYIPVTPGYFPWHFHWHYFDDEASMLQPRR